MSSDNKNKSIKCSVDKCQYHAGIENYCTLDSINVTTNEPDPCKSECTSCSSFEKQS